MENPPLSNDVHKAIRRMLKTTKIHLEEYGSDLEDNENAGAVKGNNNEMDEEGEQELVGDEGRYEGDRGDGDEDEDFGESDRNNDVRQEDKDEDKDEGNGEDENDDGILNVADLVNEVSTPLSSHYSYSDIIPSSNPSWPTTNLMPRPR